MPARFFASPDEWRRWLEVHHETEAEVLVGFYKKGSGHPSVTWPESVDVALCFSWIDGVRRSLNADSYSIRFTPRRPGSHWSGVNIRRVAELTAEGLMQPPGLKAFEARREDRSGRAAYEQESVQFDRDFQQIFEADTEAWTYFQSQPAWYRRTATWWVISAKREETRRSRLLKLIGHSRRSEPIPSLDRRPRAGNTPQ